MVATQGKSVKDNLVAVFGAKQAATLMPFKQADGEVCENASLRSSIEYNLKPSCVVFALPGFIAN